MRVYLAAPYGSREMVRGYRDQLTRIGFEVTSTWLDEQHEINSGTEGAATALQDDQVAQHANDDLGDVSQSDLIVVFTEAAVGIKGGGGRHIETGFALALSMDVIVVGEPENIFHRMGGKVLNVPHWHEAVVELSARLVAKDRGRYRTSDQVVADHIHPTIVGGVKTGPAQGLS